VNAIQCLLLRVGIEEAKIEPAVVVQKSAVRMGALAFEVGEKCAAHLAHWRNTDDR